MPRFIVVFLLVLAGLSGRAFVAPGAGMPTRPVPFTFVTDQAGLLSAGDAKKLDGGLRKYADNTGTQVVVVTVPSLNGTEVNDYARQLGTAWGVGQRGKNNGIVVLLAGKEHKLSIQAGEGTQGVLTPELTNRIINQEMTPAFKQGNYFAGLRKGLSTLMLAANPSSNPRKNAAVAPTGAGTATDAGTAANSSNLNSSTATTTTTEPAYGAQPVAEPASSGIGMGTILLGVVVIGGGIWLLMRLFKRNSAAGTAQGPDFMGNRGGGSAPNFGAPNAGYQQGGAGYGQAPGGGSGMGGILATGAAAAAGAYLGNRLSQNHDSGNSSGSNFDTNSGLGAGAAAAGTGAAGDYFTGRGGQAGDADTGPDYFSDTASSDNSGDYFSSDNSSYDDSSSDDTGGGGFDSSSDNSGSW